MWAQVMLLITKLGVTATTIRHPRVQTINVGNVIVGDQISAREAMPWQEGASQKVSGSNPGKLLTV